MNDTKDIVVITVDDGFITYLQICSTLCRFVKTSIVILLSLGASSGIYLECDYANRPVGVIGTIYSCFARIHPSPGKKNVTDVSHNHMEGRGDGDVQALTFAEDISFTPLNIHQFFPNLVAIELSNKGTSELTRSSLEGLGSLRQLSFSNNNLQTIEPDLFVENPLIEWIYFDGNPLRHIAFNVFDNLERLRVLFMADTCVTENANSIDAVDKLKFSILVHCPPTFEMLEAKIVKGSLLQSIIAAQILNEVEPINGALGEIVEGQRLLIERVDALEENHRQ